MENLLRSPSGLAMSVLATAIMCTSFAASAQDGSATKETAEAKASETTDFDAVEDVDDAIVELTRDDRIRAVSRKKFLKKGRFAAMPTLSTSVNDAFFQHSNVGARFAYHIADSFALEAGGAWNFLTVPLPSVEVVKFQQRAIPDEAILFGHLDLGFTFSPFYGKLAVLDDWIIHFDGFVSGGGGIVLDSNQYLDAIPLGISPALEVGLGARVFVTDWMVVRGEVRDYLYPQWRSGISTMQNLLMATAAVEFYVPFGFDFEYVAARVVD